MQPDFVRTLSSGAEPTDDPATPHPLEIADVEQQSREMEAARDAAVVSSRNYLII